MTLIPTHINFRGLAHSEAIDADIHERIAWLELEQVRAALAYPVGGRCWMDLGSSSAQCA